MRQRIASGIVVAAIGAAAVAGCGGDSSHAPADSSAAAAGVSTAERVWVDTSRSTPQTSHFPGEPQRRLRVRLWLPPTSRPLPLLILAHGYGGLPEKFDAFARSLAAAGFVVAAPAFPLTNADAPGGHEVGLPDTVSQPGDVSFVLTQLLAAGATPGDPLAGRMRPSEVALLGHSLGGTTAIALTHLACCRDARIRATIWVAPAAFLLGLFWSDPVAADGPPTVIIQGIADTSVPYATAPALYTQLAPPRVLVGLDGVGHSEAVESQEEPPIAARRAVQQVTVDFLDAVLRGDDRVLQTTLAGLAAEGNIVESELR
jgi:dienelactone hydrolase